LDRAEADKLAEQIVRLDERIFSAGIISNSGVGLGNYVREAYRSKYPRDREAWASVDFKQAMIFGSAKGTNRMLSELESIVFIRKDCKQILVWDDNKAVIAAAVLDKSINGTELSNKIRKLLGL
jgi:hypothetical protein